jgi:hypothetical protein
VIFGIFKIAMILVCVFNFIDLFWIFYVKRLLFWNTKAIELSIMAKARILITMPFCYEFESADDDDEYEPSDPRIAVPYTDLTAILGSLGSYSSSSSAAWNSKFVISSASSRASETAVLGGS